MKKLLIGTLAIMFSILGLQKLADTLDTAVKGKAVESERTIAANGGFSTNGSDKGKTKA
jgi:hypothetical protein